MFGLTKLNAAPSRKIKVSEEALHLTAFVSGEKIADHEQVQVFNETHQVYFIASVNSSTDNDGGDFTYKATVISPFYPKPITEWQFAAKPSAPSNAELKGFDRIV